MSSDKILAYMGFMLLIGLVQLSSMNDYWKRDPIFPYHPTAQLNKTVFVTRKKDGTHISHACPYSVVLYNDGMRDSWRNNIIIILLIIISFIVFPYNRSNLFFCVFPITRISFISLEPVCSFF